MPLFPPLLNLLPVCTPISVIMGAIFAIYTQVSTYADVSLDVLIPVILTLLFVILYAPDVISTSILAPTAGVGVKIFNSEVNAVTVKLYA